MSVAAWIILGLLVYGALATCASVVFCRAARRGSEHLDRPLSPESLSGGRPFMPRRDDARP